jgi:hypothetical protein
LRFACCAFQAPSQSDVTRVSVAKPADVQAALEKALQDNIMFKHLDEEERQQVCVLIGESQFTRSPKVFSAMFQIEYNAGSTIIKQGDEGDNFYVINSGECGIYVQKPAEVRRARCSNRVESEHRVAGRTTSAAHTGPWWLVW